MNKRPDAEAAELLETIRRAKATGEPVDINPLIEATFVEDSGEISTFTRFFIDRCQYEGVPPDRVRTLQFSRQDVYKLEELATRLGTARPNDRADYFLSAAKIQEIVEEGEHNDRFYKFLGRSFTSRGDATVVEGKLDAARDLYAEALAIYDNDRNSPRDEQDAINALVRFLYATLGPGQIPLRWEAGRNPRIDDALAQVLRRHPQKNRVFDAIAFIVYRSQYAANRVLPRLHADSEWLPASLGYFRENGIHVPESAKYVPEDFVQLWNELRRRQLDEAREISGEFRFLMRVELTPASIENAIQRIHNLTSRLFYDLDQDRARDLQRILEMVLDLLHQVAFEEKERLCIQIDRRCQDTLDDIEDNPTLISIESLYPLLELIQSRVQNYLQELYKRSAPDIHLRLAQIDSYAPERENDNRIEVQFVVENSVGRSPAELVSLTLKEDPTLFNSKEKQFTLETSLRGGDRRIVRVPLYISAQALASGAFSLTVQAHYQIRTSAEFVEPLTYNFSINLYSPDQFEYLPNPYAEYVQGGPVQDPQMFYGRDEMVENVARTLRQARGRSKSIIFFGQKRSGKSSILYHLNEKIKNDGDILVLNMGNVGSTLDQNARVGFLYSFLWQLISRLHYAIDDRIKAGYPALDVPFPSYEEFMRSPSALDLFNEVFTRFKRSLGQDGWQNTRVVVFIDEFSYIYKGILQGYVPLTFMQNWKALLQNDYFSAVLAGQDYMPKFQEHFANEFGTTEDVRVNYLNDDDARLLIERPIWVTNSDGGNGTSRYVERAVERILELTAGNPYYIQIICNRLVNQMNRRRARVATQADVEQVKEDLIRGPGALALKDFDNLYSSGEATAEELDVADLAQTMTANEKDALQVLTQVALNSRVELCKLSDIQCETTRPVEQILEDLVKRDVLARARGEFYQIRVGLFKEWLIANKDYTVDSH